MYTFAAHFMQTLTVTIQRAYCETQSRYFNFFNVVQIIDTMQCGIAITHKTIKHI